jgi:hypothetical protein
LNNLNRTSGFRVMSYARSNIFTVNATTLNGVFHRRLL